jgi:hypothetical protein
VKGLRIAFKTKDVFPGPPGFAADFAHTRVKRLLARVTEWRMTQIMGKSRRLSQFGGKTLSEEGLFYQQVLRNSPRDLSNFNAVGQPSAIKIRLPDSEDLCLPLQPAKGCAVKHAIPIPFCCMPVVLGRSRILVVSTL